MIFLLRQEFKMAGEIQNGGQSINKLLIFDFNRNTKTQLLHLIISRVFTLKKDLLLRKKLCYSLKYRKNPRWPPNDN